jgi:hypothetical protein
MVKGDAARAWQRKADAITAKYKVGDLIFSPIYGNCRIVKMNQKTLGVLQVDEQGNPRGVKGSIFRTSKHPLIVEKYLFTV